MGQQPPKEFRLNTANSLLLTWEEAFENIMEADENYMPLPGPLSPCELAQIRQVLRSTSALPEAILIQDIGHYAKLTAFLQASAAAILEWFLVLTITRRNNIVAINLHEAVPGEEIIDDLLQLDGENNEQQPVPQERWLEQEQQQAEEEQGKVKQKPGPKKGQDGLPAIHQKYPHLVADVASFILLNGFAGHESWCTEKATSCGVTLQQIRDHVHQKTQCLQISCSTTHRLMLPHSKARSLKELYKFLIGVCIPSKRNNRTCSDHEDHHWHRSHIGTSYFSSMKRSAFVYQQMAKTRSMLGH